MISVPKYARLGLPLLKALSGSWRVKENVPSRLTECVTGDEPCVIAFNHGGMLPIWYRFRNERGTAVVSQSEDGSILARYLLEQLDYARVIRGSSSRDGNEVLDAMVEELARYRVLITPDGPRGPAGVPKPGCAVAAMRADRPLIAAHWSARRYTSLDSWDSMRVPLPFTRVDIHYEEVPVEQDEDGRVSDRTMQHLKEALARTGATP